MGLIGYKAFNKDWTCRGFQYEVGKEYETIFPIKLCEWGFHFCTDISDTFRYYYLDPQLKYAKVEALGDIKINIALGSDTKCCTNRIKILEEITYDDIMNAPIKMFGEPCDWTYKQWLNSDNRYCLLDLFSKTRNPYVGLMEDTIVIHKFSEFFDNPYKRLWETVITVNRQGRPDYEYAWKRMIECLKEGILSMPNFSPNVFYNITGVPIPNADYCSYLLSKGTKAGLHKAEVYDV